MESIRRQLAAFALADRPKSDRASVPVSATRLVTTVTVLVIPLVLIVSTWGSFPATPPEFFIEPVPSTVTEPSVPAEATPGLSPDLGTAGKREKRRDRAARRGMEPPVAATPVTGAIVPNS